jgi:hypothetical protein
MTLLSAAAVRQAGGAGLCPSAAHGAALQRREQKEGAHGGTMGSPVLVDVNGRRQHRAKLNEGDRVTLGTTELTFRLEPS